MNKRNGLLRLASAALAAALCLTACGAPAASSAPQPTETPAAVGGENVTLGGRDAQGKNGVVSTGRAEATQIGVDVLKAGGNAVDAAVAIGFALGVCEQQSSGIGGGGFMMVRFAKTGEIKFLDFRDESAEAASLDMWTVDENGKVAGDENKIGAKAVAVPGEVKGMLYALDNYGTMSREEVMAPAIQLAEEGFTVSDITSRDIKDAYGTIIRFPATEKLYLDENGFPYEPGDTIRNPDLAATLRTIAAEGTGILLNDTLFDFSVDPESPNVVAGSKRPLSSMSPTLILKDGQPFMSLGAPGTTRIITGVAQVISKVIDHGMDIQDAIDAVRMHDDFGTLILEDRVSQETKDKLTAMGHELNTGEVWFTFPCVQACMRTENGILRGAADPRRDGLAMGY